MTSDVCISIIVPVFNTPTAFLDRCVESLLSQTFERYEILLVDDGSEEECAKHCDEISHQDTRITVLHKENGGVSSARNLGLTCARGDYCMFVDPDDELCDDSCLACALSVARETGADIVMGRVSYQFRKRAFANSFGHINNQLLLESKADLDGLADFFISYFPCKGGSIPSGLNRGPVSKLIKMSALGESRFDTSLVYAEDGVFLSDLCRNISRAVFVNKVWYRYYQYRSSAAHSMAFSRCRNHCEACVPHIPASKHELQIAFSVHCILNTCITNVQKMGLQCYGELKSFVHEGWVAETLRQFDDDAFSLSGWERLLIREIAARRELCLLIILMAGMAILSCRGKKPI